jgi:hypothetical protein
VSRAAGALTVAVDLGDLVATSLTFDTTG